MTQIPTQQSYKMHVWAFISMDISVYRCNIYVSTNCYFWWLLYDYGKIYFGVDYVSFKSLSNMASVALTDFCVFMPMLTARRK